MILYASKFPYCLLLIIPYIEWHVETTQELFAIQLKLKAGDSIVLADGDYCILIPLLLNVGNYEALIWQQNHNKTRKKRMKREGIRKEKRSYF